MSEGVIFAVSVCAKLLQLCPTLWDPMGCSLAGPSVPGILQARTLEWVATPSSRGPSRPRDRACVSCIACFWQVGSLPWEPCGKPYLFPKLLNLAGGFALANVYSKVLFFFFNNKLILLKKLLPKCHWEENALENKHLLARLKLWQPSGFSTHSLARTSLQLL